MKVGKLVFMVYTARSGSTLLASSLESLEEIGVTIEDKVPWGLGFFDELYQDANSIKTALKADQKFSYWNISSESIDKLLKLNQGDKILPELLKQYFSIFYIFT